MASAPTQHDTEIRVRYAEVDRMGVVHHANYLAYFEEGRTELLRAGGVTYRDVEDAGTLLVVVESGIRHLAPAHYDDLIVVRTRLAERGRVRLRFEYELLRDGACLATGHTVLASTDRRGRPKRLPADLMGGGDGHDGARTTGAAPSKRSGAVTPDPEATEEPA